MELVVIVDPESGAECRTGAIGEIWVSGPSVAAGYWNRPEETDAVFNSHLPGYVRTFLRTGDLGFLLDGELFVTGRLKDLIIIGGANHYPQDIERTVARCHPALASAECAAFSVERAGREELVVVASPGRQAEVIPDELQRAARSAVAAEHDLRLHELVLVKPGRIPRTTSGKIRRSACRSGYLSADLDLWGQP
jgi:acyl-CoA synthetase (AMP-forming)/AMP-acid ligase II